jgi:7-cyano-7-deazaguanine synthase
LKSVVLLSGGLDSIVNLKCALDDGDVVTALTFDYGQVAFANERHAAEMCAKRYTTRHEVIELDWYKRLLHGPIVGQGDVASWANGVLSDKERLLAEAWIPNRNCVFLSIAGAYAETAGAGEVVIGLNREEAEVFPDNSQTFLDDMNKVFAGSTLSGVRAVSHTAGLSKREIVELGIRVDAPLDLVYSCYRLGDDQRMCGTCQSCTRLKSALLQNEALDRLKGRFAA